MDPMHGLRRALGEIADSKEDHWAGIPMPIDDIPLIVTPTFPNADKLTMYGREKIDNQGWYMVNRWWNRRKRATITVVRKDDKTGWYWEPAFHHFDYDLNTLGASQVWGLEQEQKALQLLAGMLRHHQFKQYLLTGMFLESSERSGVTYLFRKLKPTVAIKACPGSEEMRIMCALCMHPIAYYEDSWAGAMCPTDDIIAHLTSMRGDEHHFWKKCNQHPPHRPEAGL